MTHNVTTAFGRNNHGYPYHAVCSCGYVSRGYVAEHAAKMMADYHMGEVAQ